MGSKSTEIAARDTWLVTPDLLGVLDKSAYFADTNPAWFAVLGYSAEEIEKKQFLEFVHPDDVKRTAEAFKEIQRGTPSLKFQNRYRHKDGSYRWLSWNTIPSNGRFYCSARDISAEKDNQSLLVTRDDEAQLREQFIAILGHDVRNPLASINGAARIMKREEQSERTLELLDTIEDSVGRIIKLVENLDDFARSRLGAGLQLDLRARHDLEPAIDAVISEIRMANPAITIETSIRVKRRIHCDVGRVQQLLSNLLANAVTHGDLSRPIKVVAKLADNRIRISVSNLGDPIPAEAQKMLFQPFFREKLSKSKQGLGLGLYISYQIAQAHNGTLTVASDDTETVFEFVMPI